MRHRFSRLFALLLPFVLFLPGTVTAQEAETEWTSTAFEVTVEWSGDWTTEGTAPATDTVLQLTDGEAWVTVRAEAAELSASERLEQELAGVAYLGGAEAEITEADDTSASAEFRTEGLSRLVSVRAFDTTMVIVTLVAAGDAFDDAIASAGEEITLNGDPLLATDDRRGEPRDEPDPTESATEESRDGQNPNDEATPEDDPTEESRDDVNPTEEATDEAEPEPTERSREDPIREPTDDGEDEEEETPDAKLPTREPIGDGVDGDTYTSPNFGYSFEWGNDWEVAEDGEFTSDGFDRLWLQGEFGLLAIYAFEDYGGDPASCLEGEAEFASSYEGIEDWEPAEDADGEPIAGEGDDSAWGVYTFTYDSGDSGLGGSRSLVEYIECRSLSDEAVLVIDTFSARSTYNEHIDLVMEVTDTIELYEEDAPDDDSDQDEAPGVPPAGSRNDALASVALAQPGEAAPAVSGSTYTSTGYGFSLEIPATWSIEEASADQVVLVNGTSEVTVLATDAFGGGGLAGCVEQMALADEEVLTLATRANGAAFLGGDDASAYGVYVYDEGGMERTWFVRCAWIEPGESVLVIVQDVPSAAYAAERPARRQLEAAIEVG